MPDQIRPGNMGKASERQDAKPKDFANSMADAMDTAFRNLLLAESMNGFDLDTNSQEARDRRRFFVAIAQGVVRHLKDHGNALLVVTNTGVPTGEAIQVQTDATLL